MTATACRLCDGSCAGADLTILLSPDLGWLWEAVAAAADRRGDPTWLPGRPSPWKRPSTRRSVRLPLGLFAELCGPGTGCVSTSTCRPNRCAPAAPLSRPEPLQRTPLAGHLPPARRIAVNNVPGCNGCRYGPYSERVRHLLQVMEGGFTVGLGDGTAKVLANEPISLTDKGNNALTEYLTADPQADRVSAAVNTVLRMIEGFEGPYGVELLASTHWVATREGAKEPYTAAAAVRKWTKRKGRIYSDDRVGVALERVLQTA